MKDEKRDSSSVDSLFGQLAKELEARGEEVTKGLQCIVKFEINGATWTLELGEETQRLTKGESELEPDVEMRASEENFVKLIMGSMSPQTAFMLGKLRVSGDIGTALKLTPILAAARPKAKL